MVIDQAFMNIYLRYFKGWGHCNTFTYFENPWKDEKWVRYPDLQYAQSRGRARVKSFGDWWTRAFEWIHSNHVQSTTTKPTEIAASRHREQNIRRFLQHKLLSIQKRFIFKATHTSFVFLDIFEWSPLIIGGSEQTTLLASKMNGTLSWPSKIGTYSNTGASFYGTSRTRKYYTALLIHVYGGVTRSTYEHSMWDFLYHILPWQCDRNKSLLHYVHEGNVRSLSTKLSVGVSKHSCKSCSGTHRHATRISISLCTLPLQNPYVCSAV